ncbi:glycerate kinase [Virgibacillus xinjiangensis]|uniref:Glycerate kinase n=1 Tax=Virgibacillus xinjiangensis TaxID=393090 RepID=A0ABV7CWC5_9BACI
MKIVIAPDSFKGSLTAVEAADAIRKGIRKAIPDAEAVCLPVADGGEGTMETLVTATSGEVRKVLVTGPLGNDVEAEYGVLGDGRTCVIEMATASGLALIPEGELSPLQATTYGTGQLIKHALDAGYDSFILAIGGSATNDAGAGMLQALGARLLDEQKQEIGFGGGELGKIAEIDLSQFDKRIENSSFLIASDVQNPLVGPEGASHIFGPQKGATPDDVVLLDKSLTHWADVVEKTLGVRLHDQAGAGAAGGIGGAFQAFFPGEMKRGIDVVLEYSGLRNHLPGADLVITGEGKVDHQTSSGKTPLGVAQAAFEQEVPTIIIAGSIGDGVEALYEYGVLSIHSLVKEPLPLEEIMARSAELLEFCTEQVIRTHIHHIKQGGPSYADQRYD